MNFNPEQFYTYKHLCSVRKGQTISKYNLFSPQILIYRVFRNTPTTIWIDSEFLPISEVH